MGKHSKVIFKKNYHHSKKKPRKSHDAAKNPTKRNVKFVQRGKQMEMMHRKQKILEDKYKEQSESLSLNNDFQNLPEQSDAEMEEDGFDLLLNTLSKDPQENSYQDDSTEEGEPETKDLANNCEAVEQNKATPPQEHSNNHKNSDSYYEDDPFAMHLDTSLSSETVNDLLSSSVNKTKFFANWPALGKLNIELLKIAALKDEIQKITNFYQDAKIAKSCVQAADRKDIDKLYIKANLAKNCPMPLTRRQLEMLAVLSNYNDLFYPERNFENGEELRVVYCLHALNHMLKTRSRIINHNSKLEEMSKSSSKNKLAIIPDNYRDQGLVRPKILFLLPFRESANRIVQLIVELLQGAEKGKKNGLIVNYDRFTSEYSGDTIRFPKTNPKPEDYEKTFCGNTDDNFRIGMSITKKGLKLYTDFYASDILLASPLGLRTIIGAKGSKDRDYDFLNSVEMLIVDQAEVLLAQNWENVLHLMNHLHLPLQSLHDADFQRVRLWYLNGFAQFYRQTIVLCSHELPEICGIFNNKCFNYRGKVCISNPIENGSILNVAVSTSQVFQRIDVSDFGSLFDQRFEYFVNDVLPNFRSPSRGHCMIYIPSYFDYVRLRNYFKSETISSVQICEYTKQDKIARARDIFFHSGAHFLLYSERSHFFRRTRIKGIRNLIMYQPPTWPHFYSEIINLMHKANQNARDGLHSSMSITVLYTKYDSMQLGAILGSKKAAELLQSTKSVHAFTAE